ncbi:MAG: GumC family protein [Solirubrobacterales bacterium]
MGTELRDFEATADDGQNGGMGYPGPMSYGNMGESLFQTLWRGKWLILFSAVVALAGSFAYLRKATPMYQSTSQILVDKPSPQVRSDVPVPVGSTLGNYLATQASMITSPEIVSAALRDPNVLTLPTFADPNYVRDLVGTLAADVSKKADIIQIRASSTHPQDAAQIVNAVVRAYVRWHEANRQLSTADLLKDLNRQLEQRMNELNRKRQSRILFEQRNPQVVERARSGPASSKLDLLKQDLVVAQMNAIQQTSYYERLVQLAPEPNQFRQYVYGQLASLLTATDDGERGRVTEALSRTRLQLEELAAVGTAQRAQVTMLQNRERQLTQRRADLDKEFVERCLTVAKAVKEDALAREQLLTKMYDAELEKVQSVTLQDSEYAFIISECQTLENLYNSLLTQINSLDPDAQTEGLRVYVMAKAVPATVPFSPQRRRTMMMGLILGLMAGAGLSFVRDRRDQRVRSADEISSLLGVPILGAVPSVSRRAPAHGRQLQVASNARQWEACRAIRTTLLYGVPQERSRTILVTSPGSSEGKTTLVNSLAVVMAQAGQRTLIVDADLRKSTQGRYSSGNGSDVGLTDILTGTAALEQAIRATETDGLNVLASGQSAPNPAELLNSRAFAALLEQLQGQYDRILIDSPPVAMVTDAQILATLCGSTLLVLRAEKSSRILTQRARDALLAVGVRVTGAVVTDVPPKASRYSYYSSYGYYHPQPGSNGHQARQDLLTGAAVGPEQGASLAETRESKGEAAPSERQGQGDRRTTHRAMPLEIKEYPGKAENKDPRADGNPHLDGGAPSAEEKE